MTGLATQLRAILHRYGVRSHWRATTEAKSARYAVWADGKQLGEPTDHRTANLRREDLIVADILKLTGSAGK